MKHQKNLINEGLNTSLPTNTYCLGLKGQNYVETLFEKKGYTVYKRNFRQIGLEIDLILYKQIEHIGSIDIRLVEVKTRTSKTYRYDLLDSSYVLEEFNLEHKWRRVKRILFNFPDHIKRELSINNSRHTIGFDLAVVKIGKGTGSVSLAKYIPNVNLLL